MTLALALKLLLVPLMAWLDRQRGTPRQSERIAKLPALVALGIGAALLLPPAGPWLELLTIAAVAIGYSFGFGQPIGAIVSPPGNDDYEWYQVGALRRHPMLALLVRGSLIGATFIVLYAAVLGVRLVALPGSAAGWLAAAPAAAQRAADLAIVYAGAFAAAPWLAVNLGRRGNEAWALQEYLRGGLAAAMLLSMSLGRA